MWAISKMAQNHEDAAVDLHATMQQRLSVDQKHEGKDMVGADLHGQEKGDLTLGDAEVGETLEGEEPNEYEKNTLRRVGDAFPKSAYLIAVV